MDPTPQQAEAAHAPTNVAVTAGAGTGKTRMLAWRYLHHVQQDGLSPLEIVAVTFTDKAADELRSRIRTTIECSNLGTDVAAQVEASQISTIHALAAKICRDFYDIAGLPSDFVILDDEESAMWSAAQFEKAMGGIDPSIIEELGYTWLSSVLRQLLADPLASETALSCDTSLWRGVIEDAVAAEISELRSTDAWVAAMESLSRYSGKASDKLEGARLQALEAIANIESGMAISESIEVLCALKTHVGTAVNWDSDDREIVKTYLSELKQAVKESKGPLQLSYGELDETLRRQLELVRAAFVQARTFLQNTKLAEGRIDFADIEDYALRALRDRRVVDHYTARWRAFIVDEFQDTNPVQAEMIRALSSTATLTVVGDEKQSIYGFRGADVAVFKDFNDAIVEGGGKNVPLTRTYRSHSALTNTVNDIFSPVLGDLHQGLDAQRELPIAGISEPFVSVNIVEKVSGAYKSQQQVIEARFIADQIRALTDSGQIKFSDIAILSRAWAPLDVYSDILAAFGIPAVHAGGGSLLTTREALDACAVLDFLAFPHDNIPLATILRSPFFAVSDTTLFHYVESLRGSGFSWWDGLRSTELPELQYAYSVLGQVLETSRAPADSLRELDRLTGYRAVLANLPHGSRREADWDGMLALIRKHEKAGRPDACSLSRFFKYLLDAEVEISRPPLNAHDAVSLMTVHKAKGLEWPVVFIPDLSRDVRLNTTEYLIIDSELGVTFKVEQEDEADRLEPAIYTLAKKRLVDREREESKRVLYVAMTRAQDKVVITATKEKGHALELLRPGLEAVGIVDQPIHYADELAIAPAPGEPAAFDIPETTWIEPLSTGLTSIPVTALTTFARCGAQFRFRHVLGNPGLGEGTATASSIGTLTHIALEHEVKAAEQLRGYAPNAAVDEIETAMYLANAFRQDVFDQVRVVDAQKEVSFRAKIGRVTLFGTADLVGDDFVLDYKTDATMKPEEHRFQLWAYARALGKKNAYIAYLRHGVLHHFDEQELMELDIVGDEMLEGIAGGIYVAAPSEDACRYCLYQELCSERFRDETSGD